MGLTAPHLLVIAGPTASGKTRYAVELARALGAEIVSADSQQVYRHFDVGMAKPSAEELAQVPHHLVSCVEPGEAFSAARYQALADEAIGDIHARGKPVVVVGGTGLYLRILLHGVVPAPGGDEAVRAQLDALSSQELSARLGEVDPQEAARLPPGDRRRMIRALEIHALTGQSATAHRQAHRFAQERYAFELRVLNPPREALYRRIDERTGAMFSGGLLEEVERLVARGYRDTAPMKAVGYVQALAVVEGRLSCDEAVAEAARRTRQYAKRQWTWFRKERGATFVPVP